VSTEPEVSVHPSLEALSREAASRFQRLAAESIAGAGRFSVALSGGSTPRGLYRLLGEPPLREAIDWPRVHLFWGDERFVPLDHPDSNYRLAREEFIGRVPIPSANVYPVPTESGDPQTAATRYEETLRRFFVAQRPRFDLVLLGLGVDGHTASLFPGSPALDERERLVAATQVPKLDAWRITLTPAALSSARCAAFLVSGSDKASAVRETLEGPYDPHRLPAQLVRPEEGELVWLLDEAAAGLLSPGLKGR
jgi:6-phosphogluconolactonase